MCQVLFTVRYELDGTICLHIQAQDYRNIAFGEWKNNPDKMAVQFWDKAGGIESRINYAVRFERFAKPASQLVGLVLVSEPDDFASHAATCFQWFQWNVELIHPCADKLDEQTCKGSDEAVPLRPNLQFVLAGMLIKLRDSGIQQL